MKKIYLLFFQGNEKDFQPTTPTYGNEAFFSRRDARFRAAELAKEYYTLNYTVREYEIRKLVRKG